MASFALLLVVGFGTFLSDLRVGFLASLNTMWLDLCGFVGLDG